MSIPTMEFDCTGLKGDELANCNYFKSTAQPEMTKQKFELVYDVTSFGLACMMASTLFFWLRLSDIHKRYRTALVITGMVTFIAAYHYFRIFNSWVTAYVDMPAKDCQEYIISHKYESDCPMLVSGVPFNDAYRYMDWFLTVPLLLIEIVLVMKLSPAETVRKATILGVLSAFMIIFGYPGEMVPAGSTNIGIRWLFWAVSMLPFLFIIYQLTLGTKAALDKEEDPDVKSKINSARIMTIVSWLTYPIVYIIPCIAGSSGVTGIVGVQIGYTISDIISKCGVGILIYKVTYAKSLAEAGKDYSQMDEA
jgi:bacteriorhodopsin